MKNFLKLLPVLIIALSAGCTRNHLINNEDYLSLVEKSFNERKILAVNRGKELFDVFDKNLSDRQTEALKFLYAFMPLSDLADYSGQFFLDNADIALMTKDKAPWGKDIPEDIFLHYVLPCRVNNENLDSFRISYYSEITDRIQGKNIKDAALEINHWCHEKVNYQPADIRTSAPMSTILSARGRCGEESTFTVAALRTAGIPARQVYTPRWAHSDDNHAWVEIWADGTWYYMGACEPEPVLDRGWFTEPARRAMLVHTKSFGAPYGNENAISFKRNFTEVNNLSKYAVTKKIFVRVLDKNNQPAPDALVEYKLYNYAEFYSLAALLTNSEGVSSLETGLGDLLIWASKNDDFDFSKISVSSTDTLVLRLNRKPENNSDLDLDLDVPLVRLPFESPSPDMIEANKRRVNAENLIREKYIDSWIKPDESKDFAVSMGLDTARIDKIFARCMGNYNEIRKFISFTPDSLRDLAVSLLEILADKDLRDTRADILSDHLFFCIKPDALKDMEIRNMYQDYILNPRIANEIISPWRSYFKINMPGEFVEKALKDPSFIAACLDDSIKIADEENYYKTPLTPPGVCELHVSDEASRAICFVAICRSLGIPSRLEPGRNIPQYFFSNKWNDVYFAGQTKPGNVKGYIKLTSPDVKPVPEYYIHFTLARFENGRYNTLEYDYNRRITDFSDELALPAGNYMLVTGNRLNDSRILSNMFFFSLAENEHKTIEVKLRKDISDNIPLGKIKLENILALFNKNYPAFSCSDDRGIVIIWMRPDEEPAKHILNDLPLLKKEFDSWGGSFLFLSDSQLDAGSFIKENMKGLPVNSFFSVDDKLMTLNRSIDKGLTDNTRLPLLILTDSHGNIEFLSTGYRIGIGEQILKHIKF